MNPDKCLFWKYNFCSWSVWCNKCHQSQTNAQFDAFDRRDMWFSRSLKWLYCFIWKVLEEFGILIHNSTFEFLFFDGNIVNRDLPCLYDFFLHLRFPTVFWKSRWLYFYERAESATLSFYHSCRKMHLTCW